MNGIEITAVYTIDVLAAGAYQATPAYILQTPALLMGKVVENTTISFGSSAPDDQALISITDGNGHVRTNWFTLKSKADSRKDGAMMDIEIPINEDDRGGKKVDIGFIKDGQFHLISYQIYVPWDNKELQVTLETHRDKLQPGAQEVWKVKISGKHTDAVAAEFLASMYDASLEALSAPHYWPGISWRYNYSYDRITGGVRGTTGSIRWINGYPITNHHLTLSSTSHSPPHHLSAR